MRRFLPVLLAGTLVLGSGLSGCGRVLQGAIEALPAFLINDEQEVAIGRQAAIDVVQQIPVKALSYRRDTSAMADVSDAVVADVASLE